MITPILQMQKPSVQTVRNNQNRTKLKVAKTKQHYAPDF